MFNFVLHNFVYCISFLPRLIHINVFLHCLALEPFVFHVYDYLLLSPMHEVKKPRVSLLQQCIPFSKQLLNHTSDAYKYGFMELVVG